jgi:hypothetical protein
MKNTILLLTMFTLVQTSFSQKISRQVISSSGGEARTSKTIISYTIGEPVVTTYETNTNTLTQGFQQGNITVEKNIESTYVNPELNITDYKNVSLFPNPTKGLITLNMSGMDLLSDYSYNLFDMEGRLIKTGITQSEQTQIDISSVSSGCYILVVNGSNKAIKEFKVIKEN